MKLIVGLGNPGKEYAQTRHNVGFWVLEDLAKEHGACGYKKKFESLLGEIEIANEEVMLCFPQTYMNLSGNAVASIISYFKIPPNDICVVHDELDLPLGKIKVVREGGAAGHRGVASIQKGIGTKTFCRFRLGIGKPASPKQTADFVLSTFSLEEKILLSPMLEKAREGLEVWLKQGVEAAIEYCHQSVKIFKI